jgi:hypothetical protein
VGGYLVEVEAGVIKTLELLHQVHLMQELVEVAKESKDLHQVEDQEPMQLVVAVVVGLGMVHN